MSHITNFDTYAAVKRLAEAGLALPAAEEIVASITLSRDYDVSHVATKIDILNLKKEITDARHEMAENLSEFKQEIIEKFSEFKQETTEKFAEIRADVNSLKQDVESIKKNMATKSELSDLRKDMDIGFAKVAAVIATEIAKVNAEAAKSKNDNIKWVVGLFIGVIIAIFIRPYL